MCLLGCSFPVTPGCGSWLVNTCLFFFSSQSLRPFYIATAMTYGTKPNVFVPSPETYVKNALRTLELSTRNTGYWNHEIQVLPPTCSTYLKRHLGATCSQTCVEKQNEREAQKKGLTNLTTPPLCVSGQACLPAGLVTRDLDRSSLEVPGPRFLFS